MIECTNETMRDLLPLMAAGKLPAADEARVRAHLASCEACRAEFALLQRAGYVIAAGTPRIDTARIAAAVVQATAARRPSLQAATRSSLRVVRGEGPRSTPIVSRRFIAAAASFVLVAAVAFSVIADQFKRIATQVTVDSTGRVVAASDTPGVTPAVTQVGSAPARIADAGPMIESIKELDDAELTALLAALESVEPTVDAEPNTLRTPIVSTPEEE